MLQGLLGSANLKWMQVCLVRLWQYPYGLVMLQKGLKICPSFCDKIPKTSELPWAPSPGPHAVKRSAPFTHYALLCHWFSPSTSKNVPRALLHIYDHDLIPLINNQISGCWDIANSLNLQDSVKDKTSSPFSAYNRKSIQCVVVIWSIPPDHVTKL